MSGASEVNMVVEIRHEENDGDCGDERSPTASGH